MDGKIKDTRMDKLFVIYREHGNAEASKETEQLLNQALQHITNAEMIRVDADHFAEMFNRVLEENDKGGILTVDEGDRFTSDYIEKLCHAFDNTDAAYVSGQKSFIWMDKKVRNKLLAEKKQPDIMPFTDILTGTLINIKKAKAFSLQEHLKFEMEADFLLRLTLHHHVESQELLNYEYSQPDASQYQCYQGVYFREWYFDSMDEFLIPLLCDAKKEYGKIPLFLQYYAMYAIQCRFDANSNNRNKHIIAESEIPEYLKLLEKVFALLDDAVIMNLHDCKFYSKNYQLNRMFLRIKYDVPQLDAKYLCERTTLCIVYKENVIYLLNKMRINILFMNYIDGKLEIDASVPDVFSRDKVSYYFLLDDVRQDVVFNEGYSLTKYFGVSAYKRFTFHASIPLKYTGKQQILRFAVQYEGKEYVVSTEYKSHTSRLSNDPANSYWHFDNFIATRKAAAILIAPYKWKTMAKLELKIWKELLSKHTKHELAMFLVRFGYVITRPYFKRKKIWMFYDKIYKGGDSSEYLYKYAMNKKDGIKKYYLLDKNAVDYKRMKREGYHPLKRSSIMHRLVFLNADMMIVSKSTVFAFNDFHMQNSKYVRGITDFHVVCVQHGLSVQKIALAQQRLRDNTRLYFCASKYEIENLSKPVYNYIGYDALKLTGVPRYDGLVNRNQKQILISPTWRMQSALLVSKNEGVARDYNPNFKETEYFKVYNSLINDRRLIQAAKEYGYKIAYVLHPIVSPQAEDFDKNEYVEIIPSTGEMSYEKLFCESSLMVTDYSGVQFDFAYLRKPLIYHHHRDLEAHYEEGTFHYDTMAFGEITHDNDELIDLLIDYMQHDCVMKEKYRKRADDFFAFNDNNNCQRIYDVMIDYQQRLIDKNR